MTPTSEDVLLKIDMLNDFYQTKPSKDLTTDSRGLVYQASLKPIRWARNNDIPVIWTFEMHRADLIDIGIELEGEHCIKNHEGVKLVPEIIPTVD